MQDINNPTFYLPKDAHDIAHALHNAGLHNVGQLIKSLFEQIAELEIDLEEKVEAASEEGFQNGLDAAQDDYYGRDSEKANEFATWFLREFEPESKKKIKTKEIGNTRFIIMTEEDYDDLKSVFHKMCD